MIPGKSIWQTTHQNVCYVWFEYFFLLVVLNFSNEICIICIIFWSIRKVYFKANTLYYRKEIHLVHISNHIWYESWQLRKNIFLKRINKNNKNSAILKTLSTRIFKNPTLLQWSFPSSFWALQYLLKNECWYLKNYYYLDLHC